MQMLDLVQRRKREGKDTIMLCAGQPSTGAPSQALDAVSQVLYDDTLGYTEVVGDRELREIIATWHSDTYGVDTKADNVIITTGSSGGFVNAFIACLDAGDTVAISRPGYPAYRNILEALGANIVDMVCDQSTRFQPTADMLDELQPNAVMITSPGNPTGTIIDPEELERIASWCDANNAWLISDEDYHGMSFGRPEATARQFSSNAIVVGTLSKYYSMTGWRVGWLILPDALLESVENLQASLALCAPAVSQVAAKGAFTDEARTTLDAYVDDYRAVREVFINELPKIGLGTFADPDGGLYLWLDVSEYTQDSEAWCHKLVEDIGVAFAPGVDFDPVNGNTWVRLSLCSTPELAREACARLDEYLNN
ncbi:pyridoxal phosphate-dependent aminotransferase [Corynebacterium breve]|uniref:Pyridoxal phosphate-dependent aminotransferase n=1 Tax=Corynebacterium breve TaxID=3049799 RepID=A0ABY8VLF7_9CORY|nr:pyridoxal phosphate-dependent aminotransferase [Corynebacterium breve]WIM69063.1 pyridoxal phosphate-dependent aminotransferase [Corynebacterium breve]